MKKIFIVGSAPLPNEKEGIREAAGLRTEQFLSPLQKHGYEITLIAISNSPETSFHVKKEKNKNVSIFWLSRHSRQLSRFIAKKIQETKPDVALGINTFPAYILSKVLPKNIPFWADLNGWIMAEAQARGHQENTNLHLANAFRQERQTLSAADKISTVSTAQKFVTIGELASLGLLQKDNFLEEKVFAIPNSTKFFDIDLFEKNTRLSAQYTPLFREKIVPKNAFVIAWIGGYNNWVDEKTLFEGVESAMKKNTNIYFVSSGGGIKNIANSTFSSFRSRIQKSPYSDRFIFLGWVDTSDMKKIYKESDIGLNIDFLCIETETGARNRINEMMKFGLPVLSTAGSEIGEIVGRKKAGITIKNGDKNALEKGILQLSSLSKTALEQYGQNGQDLSTTMFCEEITVAPLLHFMENPEKTCLSKVPIRSPFFFLKNIYQYWKRNSIKVVWAKICQRIF